MFMECADLGALLASGSSTPDAGSKLTTLDFVTSDNLTSVMGSQQRLPSCF
ncbi:MAG: hypothetical protein ACJAQZ_000103 [Planctomycetota bacterium]|jgi:hypothetical protein